jgi:hypothetical protein
MLQAMLFSDGQHHLFLDRNGLLRGARDAEFVRAHTEAV